MSAPLRPQWLAGACLALAGLAACRTARDIDIDDGGRLTPGVRVHRGFEGNEAFELEFEVTGVDGEGTQTVGASEEIDLGGPDDIDGPADVLVRFDLILARAAARWRVVHEQGFHLWLMAGVAYTDLDLDLQEIGGPQTLGFEDDWIGPSLALEAAAPLNDFFALQGRVERQFGIDDDLPILDVFEAGAKLVLGPNVELWGGWKKWRYRTESLSGGSLSELSLDADGPAVTLIVSF